MAGHEGLIYAVVLHRNRSSSRENSKRPLHSVSSDSYPNIQVFQMQVLWSDDSEYYIYRRYSEFYSFQVSALLYR